MSLVHKSQPVDSVKAGLNTTDVVSTVPMARTAVTARRLYHVTVREYLLLQ